MKTYLSALPGTVGLYWPGRLDFHQRPPDSIDNPNPADPQLCKIRKMSE
jgi:hypothetical protein